MEIEFGLMTPTIACQLKDQNLKYNGQQVRYCEKLLDCITHLTFSDIITEKQAVILRKKLLKKINSTIQTT